MTSSENIPEKPPEMAVRLYKLGGEVESIRVKYVPTGTDTADTFWEIRMLGSSEKIEAPKSSLVGLLDFFPDFNVPSWRSIANLKKKYSEMVATRLKWEKDNDHELKEYRRLKEKFEGKK